MTHQKTSCPPAPAPVPPPPPPPPPPPIKPIAVPYNVTLEKCDSVLVSAGKYHVSHGNPTNSFVNGNSPDNIKQYNWLMMRSYISSYVTQLPPVVQSNSASQVKHDFSDRFTLTSTGCELIGKNKKKKLYFRNYACAGGGSCGVGKANGANCEPFCPKGGVEGCTTATCKQSAFHKCRSRMLHSGDFNLVTKGKVCIEITGKHVSEGKAPVPVNPLKLRPDKVTERHALLSVAEGNFSATQVRCSQIAPLHRAGGEVSTRFAMDPKSLQNKLNQINRVQRGVAADDWDRSNNLITNHIIQQGKCLLFERLQEDNENSIAVFAENAGLKLLRDHEGLCSTDSKHDATTGVTSFISSLFVSTQIGWYPVGVWVGSVENTNTISRALEAFALAVPCSDPNCSHDFNSEGDRWSSSSDGRVFKRTRECSPCTKDQWKRPCVAIDKHWPSFNAVRQSPFFDQAVLDGYHKFLCLSKAQVKYKIEGDTASVLIWAFRIWLRSPTAERAKEIRTATIDLVVSLCAAEGGPTFEVGEAYLGYLDRCWFFSDFKFASVDAYLHDSVPLGLVISSSANEGWHALWDRVFMHSKKNRDLVSVLSKLTGSDAAV